jgi:tetratricopeptide (TPR) repeat protein
MSESSEQPRGSTGAPDAENATVPDGVAAQAQPGSPEGEPQPFILTLPDDPASRNDWYLWAAVLALVALVAFWPSINGSFLWDDDRYVSQNHALLTYEGMKDIWRLPAFGREAGTIQYYPLTFATFWVEHHFWGAAPLGYRVDNLILHALGAIVLWRILRRLRLPGAWIAAALWAAHPLQAESVCWISERKNVLSGVLALASLIFYLDFAGLRDPDSEDRIWRLPADWQSYALALLSFALALCAKSVVAFLPATILVILWWKRRLNAKTALGTIPMFILGLLMSYITAKVETDPNGAIRATGPEWSSVGFGSRLFIAGRGFWFYIAKLFLPLHLSFNYPRVIPTAGDVGAIALLLGAIALPIVLGVLSSKIGRGPVAAVLCYGLAIFPALGFVDVYPQRFSFVADHFQYLAGIPLIVLFVAIAAHLLEPLWKSIPNAVPGGAPSVSGSAVAIMATMLLLLVSSMAWARASVFADPAELWADVLQPDKNPSSWLAAVNLAKLETSDASRLFDHAANDIKAQDQDSANQDGKDGIARLDASDQLLRDALANPETPSDIRYRVYNQLAENDITRFRSPDANKAALMADAEVQLGLALANPNSADDALPRYTMGIVKLNEAMAFQSQVTTRPSEMQGPVVHPTTRPATAQEQKVIDAYTAAQTQFGEAMQKAYDHRDSPILGPESQRVFPLAVFQRGNMDWALAAIAHDHNDVTSETKYDHQALADYALATRANPTSVPVRFKLALCLEAVGDLQNAHDQLLFILKNLDNYNAQAYNEIGRVILEQNPTNMRDFQTAVESFKAALNLDPNFEGAKENLALAMRMYATSRPVTEPSTAPSAAQTALPATMPDAGALAK